MTPPVTCWTESRPSPPEALVGVNSGRMGYGHRISGFVTFHPSGTSMSKTSSSPPWSSSLGRFRNRTVYRPSSRTAESPNRFGNGSLCASAGAGMVVSVGVGFDAGFGADWSPIARQLGAPSDHGDNGSRRTL